MNFLNDKILLHLNPREKNAVMIGTSSIQYYGRKKGKKREKKPPQPTKPTAK